MRNSNALVYVALCGAAILLATLLSGVAGVIVRAAVAMVVRRLI